MGETALVEIVVGDGALIGVPEWQFASPSTIKSEISQDGLSVNLLAIEEGSFAFSVEMGESSAGGEIEVVDSPSPLDVTGPGYYFADIEAPLSFRLDGSWLNPGEVEPRFLSGPSPLSYEYSPDTGKILFSTPGEFRLVFLHDGLISNPIDFAVQDGSAASSSYLFGAVEADGSLYCPETVEVGEGLDFAIRNLLTGEEYLGGYDILLSQSSDVFIETAPGSYLALNPGSATFTPYLYSDMTISAPTVYPPSLTVTVVDEGTSLVTYFDLYQNGSPVSLGFAYPEDPASSQVLELIPNVDVPSGQPLVSVGDKRFLETATIEVGGTYFLELDFLIPGSVWLYVEWGSYTREYLVHCLNSPDDFLLNLYTPDGEEVGKKGYLGYQVGLNESGYLVDYRLVDGFSSVELNGDELFYKAQGGYIVEGSLRGTSITALFHGEVGDGGGSVGSDDPYEGMSESEFYRDYEPAGSHQDALYRSEHGFMSGSLDEQDQEPTLSSHRPIDEEGLYLKNMNASYVEGGRGYQVLDVDGNLAFTVYEGGGYVTLEEVAAYVFAFGDVPANYHEDRYNYPSPSSSPWGKFLRLNNSYFSGDTDKFPYEPLLPDISWEGGHTDYYEIDIGTTGTDCDPSYETLPYNNGYRIERGAARIVYQRYRNGQELAAPERKLFYTYNHYNDFQEYLNYEGGWGEMFGNITGGGSISSETDYNPTPYVEISESLYL